MTILTNNQKAALNYKDHIALTANAGSGKTFVLSKRYLEIAYNENISLRSIAAITFTDKASGELYRKISNEVNQRLEGTNDRKEKAKLEKIRRQLVSANISTIHSFCIDILRDFPLEAQLDANFSAIDKNTSDELIQLSIEEVLRNSLKDTLKQKQVQYLIRVFASKKLFSDILFSLIEKRKNFLKLIEDLYSKSEDEVSLFFYNVFCGKVSDIIKPELAQLMKNLYLINEAVLSRSPKCITAIEAASQLRKIYKEQEIKELIAALIQLKDKIITKTSSSIKKLGYLKDEDRKILHREVDYVEEYFRDFGCFSIPEDHQKLEYELAVFGKNLSSVFTDVLNLYTEKKRLNGYLDFEDILIKTREVLSDTNVSESLSEKYKYIMVDEYQDTNEIQFDIIMPILDYLNNGNLFVVGDEKQSIYMFRDAELAIFERTKKEISYTSGTGNVLTLPDTFRMSKEICLFTNNIFRNLFKDPKVSFNEVQYTDIVCGKDDTEPGHIEFLLADKEQGIEEAELIALKIIELSSRETEKINLGEIAILCRKRRSFYELEKVLNKYKLPFTVLGGKGFYQQQIIYDIYNYLSFLLNKNNDAALAGLLRSPFFSVSDAELFEISILKGNTFWDKFKIYSAGKNKRRDICNILEENIYFSRTTSFPELLRKILNESWFLSVISSRRSAEQDLANIDKLINIAISFSNQNFRTLYDFVTYLESAINTQEEEGHAALTTEDNTIKIMTVHQSKGLEYKCIFLFNSHDTTQRDSARAKDISLDKDLGFLTALPFEDNFFEDYRSAPVVNLYNYIMKRKNLAEIKRLLYVAVTRAKNYLFISASHKDFNFKKESFISLLMKGLDIDNFSMENIIVNDNLTFLSYTEEGGYENPVRYIQLNIPVTKVMLHHMHNLEHAIKPDINEFLINVNSIPDFEEEEIISATKIAVFNQCPVKYQFTYEFGYLNLFKQYKGSIEEPDFSSNSEDELSIGDIKGNIVHSILEKEISTAGLPEYTELLIRKSLDVTENSDKINYFKQVILDELSFYFNSTLYSEIKSFSQYYNEYEIYCKNNDYYLYGVIDKLIIDGSRAIIVDYKTDAVTKDKVDSRINNYLPQLMFYAFLVCRHFPDIENLELRLVFIRLPDEKVSFTLTRQEAELFGNKISEIVKDIRTKTFTKNLQHCYSCYYAVNNHCIK